MCRTFPHVEGALDGWALPIKCQATTQTACTHFPIPPRASGLLLLRREPLRTHRPSVCFQSAWPLPLGLPLTLLLPEGN